MRWEFTVAEVLLIALFMLYPPAMIGAFMLGMKRANLNKHRINVKTYIIDRDGVREVESEYEYRISRNVKEPE